MKKPTIKILADSEHFLVIDKPAGLLSQPDKTGDEDVAAALRSELDLEFLAPVHRLDRNTSGCLILAKTNAAASALSTAIKAGKVKRTYHAMVKGSPDERGTIDAPLQKNEGENRSFVSKAGKPALTHYVRLKKCGATSLVEVTLDTGRSHQIRAHFSYIGCPLIGDKKYGKKPWSEIYTRPALHAISVEFPHPVTKEVCKISCPLPDDLRQLIQKLSGGV